ncbi:hypothetical protein [Sphaerisporangium flaviroseum]
MEPLTEHRGVSDLIVYGFLQLVRTSAARQEALTASLSEYCRQHELLLSGVFIERSAYITSAAFTGLLDALALPGIYGVVLPAASHLGRKAIAAERERRIDAAGARLLLIRRTPTPRLAGRSPSSSPT